MAVVRLTDPAEQTANQDAMVEMLETIIAEIRSGRTVAFAIATVTADYGAVDRWMAVGHVLATIGAVARLQAEISDVPE